MKETFRAWQPLTFGGVARYGHDWFGRIFVTALIIAVIISAAVVLTVRSAWQPVLEKTMAESPPGAEIRSGRFTSPKTIRIEESPFLAIRFDPEGNLLARSASEIELTFEPTLLRVRSFFGVAPINYPPHWTIDLNRNQLEPWWGAWKPAVYGYLALGTILSLFGSWIGLGILYAIPTRIGAAILKKQLTLWGAFKMAVAALMPAAVLLTIGILLYGWGQLRLMELFVLWVIHFVVGWIFLAGAVFRLPKIGAKNPFLPQIEEDEEDEEAEPVRNPFQRRKG